MELKPGYKQTEIGVIPDDWEPAKFGSLCHRRRESGVPTAESFLIELEHIESGSGRLVGEAPVQTMSSKRVFQKGDVLFGRLRSYLRKYLLAERDGFCSTEIWALVPENERVESGFLFQVVRLDGFITATGISYGTHMPRSDWSTIKEWPLSLPPVKEQRAIAEALSDVDALINSLEALLTKKRNIKTGVMQELLTGRTRLPGFTADWEVKMLGEIADFTNGKPNEQNVVVNGRFLLVTLDSINIRGELKTSHKLTNSFDDSLRAGDIVTVLSDIAHGNLLGLCGVIPLDHKYVLNQRMGRIRVHSGYDPGFIRLKVNRDQNHFKKRGQGTSQRHIYRRDFDCLKIGIPNSIREQEAIAEVLSDMDDEIEALDKRRDKTRDLKQGMAQELLTGRTRLV